MQVLCHFHLHPHSLLCLFKYHKAKRYLQVGHILSRKQDSLQTGLCAVRHSCFDSVKREDTCPRWALQWLENDLLSVAALMHGLYLNSICTWICIQFVCCDINRVLLSGHEHICFYPHQIWRLHRRDITVLKQTCVLCAFKNPSQLFQMNGWLWEDCSVLI